MKRIYIALILLAAFTMNVAAQHYDIDTQKKIWKQMVADTVRDKSTDNETLKLKNEKLSDHDNSLMPSSVMEYGWGLHRGLNASVGLSAFAVFSGHAPHRGGFGQDINISYLSPLTRDGKLWLNAGGYFNNTLYGGDSYRDAGLYAMLGYQFNEHWETYVYGQLSLTNNYRNYWDRYYGYGPYGYGWGYSPARFLSSPSFPGGMGVPGANVIGAGVKYNVNHIFSIGLNVEGVWYNDNMSGRNNYWGKYKYPVPEP